MSTRANYEFYNKEHELLGMCYIHHDGYPEGAAGYFQNCMLKHGGKLTLEGFIRANDKCELCTERAGDIEYLYCISVDTQEIRVFEHSFRENSMHHIDTFTAQEFVNKYFTVYSYNEKLRELRAKDAFFTEERAKEQILFENKYIDGTCLQQLYEELLENTKELVESACAYGVIGCAYYLNLQEKIKENMHLIGCRIYGNKNLNS